MGVVFPRTTILTLFFAIVLVSLKRHDSSTISGAEGCVWTFESCSSTTPSHPLERGECCFGNATSQNGTLSCRKERRGASAWTDWQSWSPWSSDSGCTSGVVSVNQTRVRVRRCEPCEDCVGDSMETDETNRCCAIQGAWSEWSDWSPDSATCGDITNRRQRSCNGHRCNGFCPGSNSETRTIFKCCSGVWTDWSHWTQWSPTCGDDMVRHRTRECGSNCSCIGEARDFDTDKVCCPVNGGWHVMPGNWSGVCGWVTRTVNRTCTNPLPKCYGRDCEGLSSYVEEIFKSCDSLSSSAFVDSSLIITSSITPYQASPTPHTGDNGFLSDFNVGVAIAIIVIPLLFFLSVVISVIVCAVRRQDQKSGGVAGHRRRGDYSVSGVPRYRTNIPQTMKVTWSQSIRRIWWGRRKDHEPPSIDEDRSDGKHATIVANNSAVVSRDAGVDTSAGINAAMGLRQVSNRDSRQMVMMPSNQRQRENILYEGVTEGNFAHPSENQPELFDPYQSDFSTIVPLQTFSHRPIDQRPAYPLPTDNSGPYSLVNRVTQTTRPSLTPQSSTGVQISTVRRISNVSQPVESDDMGVLVTNMSPQGFSTLERLSKVGRQDAIPARLRNENERAHVSSLQSDPGYETLSKYGVSTIMSVSSPPPVTSPTSSVGAIVSTSPVAELPSCASARHQIRGPVTVHASSTPHTFMNEDQEDNTDRSATPLSDLPTVAQQRSYMPMALHGSIEFAGTGSERRIRALSNPMYGYPMLEPNSSVDQTQEVQFVGHRHVGQLSGIESGYRSVSPVAGVAFEAKESGDSSLPIGDTAALISGVHVDSRDVSPGQTYLI